MKNIYGEEIVKLDVLENYQNLQRDIETIGKENTLTSLTPDLDYSHPDDAVSSVPYGN